MCSRAVVHLLAGEGDTVGLRYPKKKRVKKKRLNLAEFHNAVIPGDNLSCQDKTCRCHKHRYIKDSIVQSPLKYALEAHHIISRSIAPDKRENVANGITLCRVAHRKAEEGHGSGPDRVSATEYMIGVLESHREESTFRWDWSLEELKLRRDRKK